MNNKKLKMFAIVLLVAFVMLTLVACSANKTSNSGSGSDNTTANTSSKDAKVIKIATMEEFYFKDIVKVVKEKLEKEGYKIEIVTIADNVTPNVATVEGSVDYNFYEHIPFLDAFNESPQGGGNLVVIGKPVTAGVEGLHSNQFASLNEITDGALVAIPNDSSNRTMHLKFMDRLGLIKLKENLDMVTLLDIEDNPRNFKFIEMDTPSIVGSLSDVDLGTCSQSSIVKRGLDPSKALATYVDDSLGIVLVTKKGNEDTEISKKIYEAFTSQEVKDFLENNYKDVVEPLF